MAGQTIPQLQQNSLPLQTIAEATAGAVVNFGNGQSRFWDSATLGVSGAVRSTLAVGGGSYFFLATNYLDLRGLSSFALLLTRSNPSVDTAVPFNANLWWQMRLGVADAPAVTEVVGASENELPVGKVRIATTNITFPAKSGAGITQRLLLPWNVATASPDFGANATIGYDVRFVVSWGTNDPVNTNLFSMYLWGQG